MNVIERKAIIRNDKKTTPKDFRLDFKFNICFVDIPFKESYNANTREVVKG